MRDRRGMAALALLAIGAGACMDVAGASMAAAQSLAPLAPVSRRTVAALRTRPDILRELMSPHLVAVLPSTAPVPGSPWQSMPSPPFSPGAMLLLTDGTVMVQSGTTTNGGSDWWKLTPDNTGGYLNGTWSQLASMPAGYAPLYFGSAVLPDGRVIVEGGEYNNGVATWTSLGAIYDPVANAWTAVAPPPGVGSGGSSSIGIGDAASTVLANGQYMLAPVGTTTSQVDALLDAATLTWTLTGSGKVSGNDEAALEILPSGHVLTVDIDNGTNAEMYDPTAGAWVGAGSTVVQLYDSASGEIGPQVLRPDGTVLAVGASGHNAFYSTKTATWTPGPNFPVIGGAQYDVADGPAAVLPSGKVLVAASPGVYQKPVHFFMFDGAKLTRAIDTANAPNLSSYYCFMLVLPTGQVMVNTRFGDVELYTDTGAPKAAWAPVISSVPATIAAGKTFKLTGKQLSGLSRGASYGDDYQSATNYPLVRIVNNATGHVSYARTFGTSKVGVNAAVATTNFTVPAAIEVGASSLYVVANGIPSAAKPVTVTP